MTYIKMGSDESHFNVSLIVRVKVTRQGPSAYQPTVLPLGQTGSHNFHKKQIIFFIQHTAKHRARRHFYCHVTFNKGRKSL